jgi:hypothetical protein
MISGTILAIKQQSGQKEDKTRISIAYCSNGTGTGKRFY